MDVTGRNTGQLVQPSRVGDLAALPPLLDTCWNLLTRLARLQIGPKRQGRILAFDAVPETLLQAHRSIGQNPGWIEAGFLQWLRSIRTSKLDFFPYHKGGKSW